MSGNVPDFSFEAQIPVEELVYTAGRDLLEDLATHNRNVAIKLADLLDVARKHQIALDLRNKVDDPEIMQILDDESAQIDIAHNGANFTGPSIMNLSGDLVMFGVHGLLRNEQTGEPYFKSVEFIFGPKSAPYAVTDDSGVKEPVDLDTQKQLLAATSHLLLDREAQEKSVSATLADQLTQLKPWIGSRQENREKGLEQAVVHGGNYRELTDSLTRTYFQSLGSPA